MGRPVILGRQELRQLASDLWTKYRICKDELSALSALSYLPVSEANSYEIVQLLRQVRDQLGPRPTIVRNHERLD